MPPAIRKNRALYWLPRRLGALFSDGWSELRYHWHTRNTGNLLFFSIPVLVVTAFGILIYAVVEDKNDTRNLTCLALNVYFEARGEPRAGQYAVAEVTMNRVASKRYPDTVCAVVHQKKWDRLRRRYVGAFSWTELNEKPALKSRAWNSAWEAAEAVYYKRRPPQLDGALFYHARSIRPSWARKKKPVARIGRHIFYK